MPALALKATATVLTFLAAAFSAGYVAGHVKSGAAPLHPSVVGRAAGAQMTLTPSVRAANVEPVTSTYAS